MINCNFSSAIIPITEPGEKRAKFMFILFSAPGRGNAMFKGITPERGHSRVKLPGWNYVQRISRRVIRPTQLALNSEVDAHNLLTSVIKVNHVRYIYAGDVPTFKSIMAFWNFNMGIDGKILKCFWL